METNKHGSDPRLVSLARQLDAYPLQVQIGEGSVN